MSASVSVRPIRFGPYRAPTRPTWPRRCWLPSSSRSTYTVAMAGYRADDSTPFRMSVENALTVLGVSEAASFDDILRAKNAILATCKDDPDAISQVEAAYDKLLMQNFMQRRAGKVVDNKIRFADVKPANTSVMRAMPRWLQSSVKSPPVTVENPRVGVQAGVYGAMMVLTYINGTSSSSAGPVAGADVPGIILATSFGASLYFMTKKNVSLCKGRQQW